MTTDPSENLDAFVEAITEARPLVLLLGQLAWASHATSDPILSAAAKRAGIPATETSSAGYKALLGATRLSADFYGWLAEQYERHSEPDWFDPIVSIPWNAVFTSSIAPTVGRSFRVNGREVEAVLSATDNPSAPRHRRLLHITYLFGRAGDVRASDIPPGSTAELLSRTALHANSLLARLPETATALGCVAIDGYVPKLDWLQPDTLAGVLSAFGPRQVYWFGWTYPDDEVPSSIRQLAAQGGPIVPIQDRLSIVLRKLFLDHRINLSSDRIFADDNSISVGDALLNIPPATRLKTAAAATIVDDTWLSALAPLGVESTYDEFRRFHGFSEETRRLFDGIRRGFAIERTFEKNLLKRVEDAIGNPTKASEPILLHGQSGAGKTLALTRLAVILREKLRVPVLFAARSARIPAVSELDDFCQLAEQVSAPATLIICDANAPVRRYREFLQGFRSRGRKVVVVGSAYRVVDDEETLSDTPKALIEITPRLDSTEAENLRELLGRFVPGAAEIALPNNVSASLLAALYRLLPDVRTRLSIGLAQEARVAESDLRVRGGTPAVKAKELSALALQLIEKGFSEPNRILSDRIVEIIGSVTDAAARLIDYVMVSGKLDCPIPVNLLLRAVGSGKTVDDVIALFRGIDLFRWTRDAEDDIYIQPRLRLEAELICARRLGLAEAETAVALDLLNYANLSGGGWEGSERRFVVDLSHALGPDGPHGKRYVAGYLRIARLLTELRKRSGLHDPSLMLQEATLRRRVFRDAPVWENAPADSATVLDEARQIVDAALEEFGSPQFQPSRGMRRMLANFKVERAAIYGFLAVQRLRAHTDPAEAWQYYLAARDAARNATANADNYFGLDVSLWVPNDVLRFGTWDANHRAELTADILDAISTVEPELLDLDERTQFDQRRFKIAQTLGDEQLAEDAFQALDAGGSTAGYFLRARSIGGDLSAQQAATVPEIARATAAADYLKTHYARIKDDPRCLRYLLRARWLSWTGRQLFGRERSPIPRTREECEVLLELVERIHNLQGAASEHGIRYLEAVLLWRLGREQEARTIWRDLSRETDYGVARRVIRQHVYTGADGNPALFHGRIQSDELGSTGGRWRVFVEELRQEIELLAQDFPGFDFQRGRSIPGGFYIAFNYIGPVADPLRRRDTRR